MMKKMFISGLLLVSLCLGARAQDADPEPESPQDPQAKARIDAARAAYITKRLGLSAEEAERFWPIYREFADKRQSINERFIEARKEGKDEQQLVELGLQLKQQELDLEREYSGRIMKVISAQKLMDLRSAETEFRRIIIRQLRQRQQQIERQQQLRDRQQDRIQQRNN